MSRGVDLYNGAYGNFAKDILMRVRGETYGEDIGQSGWMTADECRRFLQYLELNPASNLLDLCSGSGGPSLFMAETIGCRVTGVDINENGIRTAQVQAEERGLSDQVQFQRVDAGQPMPFGAATCDTIICIDAIIHIPNRLRLLKD